MSNYKPVRLIDAAIPDAINDLRRRVNNLSASVSTNFTSNEARSTSQGGSINPQFKVLHGEATQIPALSTPNTSVVSVSVNTPEEANQCLLMVSMNGFCASDGVSAHKPYFCFRINNNVSNIFSPIADGVDATLFHISGNWVTTLSVNGGLTVTVEIILSKGKTVKASNLASPQMLLNVFTVFTS